ncbi:MAG: MarR family transcriptional regulator [Sciscionella sp.]|nr:MarR family transcriptional regulator [Sciscionella sp.]
MREAENAENIASDRLRVARNSKAKPGKRLGVAFLLAQLGSLAANQYGDRIADLDLTRAQSGVLFSIAREPGRSQQVLAVELGTPATRLVALLDALEQRGAIERRRNPADRRNHALYLTEKGRQLLRRVGTVAAAHEKAITAPLADADRERLHALLGQLADHHGLTPGVHPGYRDLTVQEAGATGRGRRAKKPETSG